MLKKKNMKNLVRCFLSRVGKICSNDTVNKKLELIQNILIEVGYLQGVLKKHAFLMNRKIVTSTVSKKALFLMLQFTGNVAREVL